MLAVDSVTKKILLGAGLLAVLVGLNSWLNSPMLLSVIGYGEVSAKASKASMSLSLSDYNQSPVIASQNVGSKADTLKAYLKTKGIESANIIQSQVQVTPAGAIVQGLTGYQATLSMGITVTDMSKLDNLVPTLYEKGASVVTQPVLQVADEASIEEQALQMAMKDANSRATKMGFNNWKFFKQVASISVSTNQVTSTVTNSEKSTNSQMPADNTFKAAKQVSVTYRMW